MYTREDYAKTRSNKEKVPRNVLQTVIGEYAKDGNPVIHDFDGEHGNIMIVGKPGSGKNVLGTVIQYDIMQSYSYKDVEFIIVDFCGSTENYYSPFYRWTAGLQNSDDMRDYVKVINRLSTWWSDKRHHPLEKTTILIFKEITSLCGRFTSNTYVNAMTLLEEIANIGYKYNTYVVNISMDYHKHDNFTNLEFYRTKIFLSHKRDEELAKFCRLSKYGFNDYGTGMSIGFVSTFGKLFVPYYTVFIKEEDMLDYAYSVGI